MEKQEGITEIKFFFLQLQKEICTGLESFDQGTKFKKDKWIRKDGGGGLSCVIEAGKVLEKGGVNFSEVFGKTPDFLLSTRNSDHSLAVGKKKVDLFFATGISLVIHPRSPWVPIIHMNLRYFETGGVSWFGGGIDLTPHYINPGEATFFHSALKKVCDQFHKNYYPEFKRLADDYFFIKHRNETRGIGGIFFDKLSETSDFSFLDRFEFIKAIGKAFLPIYSQIVNDNLNKKITLKNREWQLIRRGRYAEFNLVYDKGTKFGFETNGRTESILMSLPPESIWKYRYEPKKGTKEFETNSLLKKEINWLENKQGKKGR